ncbi:MAG: hypothetical protein EAX86_02305 [Candidatus Heimdallarchaeota archaeon]|nr:hypothetical protein [Candidatus Heimdallarchaeota archaeon]
MAIQQQNVNLSDPITLILLIIAIILVAIFLWIGTRLIAGKKDTDTSYVLILLVVAAIIVILVALVIGALVGVLSPIPFVNEAAARLVPILVYLAIVYLIDYLIVPERNNLNSSIWIGVITIFLIYLFNAIIGYLFPGTTLISAGV